MIVLMLTSRVALEHHSRLVQSISARGPIVSRDGLVDIYRGIRNVEGASLTRPGQYWSLSISAAVKYSIPDEPLFVRAEGPLYVGHLLKARLPIDFSNASCALGELIDLMLGKKILNPSDNRDLFEVVVPHDQCACLVDVSVLYTIKSTTFISF